MIKILKYAEIESQQWQNLIKNSTFVSFFQTKECYDFYCKLTFLKPVLFGVSENDKLVGLICGYLIAEGGALKKFFSKRIIIPGGLLLDSNISSNALNYLLISFKSYFRSKANYLEIRNFSDYSIFQNEFEKSGFKYQLHLNFHLNTSNFDVVVNNLSSSKRRQIKLTEKAGVICKQSQDIEDITAFYAILKNLYKRKIKTPLFPISFFQILANQDFAKFFIVKNEDTVLGGIFCVMLDNKTIYEWFVCGIDTVETRKKNIYPSVYATFTAIKYASENGFENFDFMGAGKPDQAYGVRDFKSKFGGDLVEHGRFLCINKSLIYNFSKFIISLKLFKQ